MLSRVPSASIGGVEEAVSIGDMAERQDGHFGLETPSTLRLCQTIHNGLP